MLNGIKTQGWSVAFNKGSLDFIVVTIESENSKQNFRISQDLRKNINTLSYSKYSPEDNFWIMTMDEKTIGGLQLTSSEKATLIMFSSNKYINKYSYL